MSKREEAKQREMLAWLLMSGPVEGSKVLSMLAAIGTDAGSFLQLERLEYVESQGDIKKATETSQHLWQITEAGIKFLGESS